MYGRSTHDNRHQFAPVVSVSCLFTPVCLLWQSAMSLSCPLSAVSTEIGERSFRVEFSPILSSTQTRCVLLGCNPPPPALLPPPTLCSPFLKTAASVRLSFISSEASLQGWIMHCCCCPCGLSPEQCPQRLQVSPPPAHQSQLIDINERKCECSRWGKTFYWSSSDSVISDQLRFPTCVCYSVDCKSIIINIKKEM